ncbi:MAG: cation:proton antiporter [Pirellulales bacterium]
MSTSDSSWRKNPLAVLAAYGLMIAAAIALFFAVRSYGETLLAPPPAVAQAAGREAAPEASSRPLLHLLLALASVIVLGRALGWMLGLLGQPPVIGEVLAGICLGPSVLGRLAPEVGRFVLPDSVAPALSVVAQISVILYMFVVGLELNAGLLRRQGHVTLAISHASIVVPFSLAAILALWLYPMLSTSDVRFTTFALFLCVSLSITAFPVLARILTDRQMQHAPLGVTALACAAIDDVSAWCLLALVVGVARERVNEAVFVAVLAACYIVLMFTVVRPLVDRLIRRFSPAVLTPGALAALLVGALASALATEAIGVHAIFGAFLFGAVIPHDSPIARQTVDKLRDFVAAFLLPAFFALSGMRTRFDLVSGWHLWFVCLAIIAVATLGKFGGTLAAARLMRLPWRDSASLGILMNTRGLMELIVLNVGLDLGVISPTLFAMLVLMALVTTVATSPVLYALVPKPAIGAERPGKKAADAARLP